MEQTIEQKEVTKEKAKELIDKFEYLKKYNFNFFYELAKMDNHGKGINEECHSKILAWLLNAQGKNENTLQYCFLKKFLQNLQGLNIENIDTFMKELSTDLVVITEYNHIDIFLYSKNADFVCVIENKIDSELGNEQLKRYSDFINNSEYASCKYKSFVYLRRYINTKNKSDEKQILENKYQEIEYSDIANMIDKSVLCKAENDRMYFNVLQYKEYLDLYWYDTVDGVWIEKVKNLI